MEDLKKLVKENKICIGRDVTVKNLRAGKVSKVFIASNCADNTKEDIKHYAELAGTEAAELDMPNDELGLICRKPFSVSVIGVIRE